MTEPRDARDVLAEALRQAKGPHQEYVDELANTVIRALTASGYRFVPVEADPPGLDVERLAAAICNAEATKANSNYTFDRFMDEAKDLFRREAVALAVEYAALASPAPDSEVSK